MRPTITATRRPELSDADAFQQRLTHWNHRRLAPATPYDDWLVHADEDARMILIEGGWVERLREDAVPWLADLPEKGSDFVEWFEALKGVGPGEGDPLFPWLAEQASLEEMRWFLLQEVAGEAGFEDLVALAQVKMPDRPKMELARNYWDEMGRGSLGGMHGPMLAKLAAHLSLDPVIETTVAPSLALGNLLVAFSTTRRYAYHALGALGAVELTAPWRAAHVAAGLKRLQVGPERKYYALHATLDVEHSRAWNDEVFAPLAEMRPECVRSLAEGAVMRLMAGAACYRSYRESLWGAEGQRRSA